MGFLCFLNEIIYIKLKCLIHGQSTQKIFNFNIYKIKITLKIQLSLKDNLLKSVYLAGFLFYHSS